MIGKQTGIAWVLAGLSAGLLVGCRSLDGMMGRTAYQTATGASAPPAANTTATAEPFSSELAFAHLQALAELGPRPSGSSASQAAAEYLRSRLEAAGLTVEDVEFEVTPAPPEGEEPAPHTLRHVVAHIPSESPDLVMLVARYDSRGESVGANDGASGAAVLLELARQLAERPLPFATELWFLDGESGDHPDLPGLAPFTGSSALIQLGASRLEGVRVAVALRQVGDAELSITRDLYSQRLYREDFFEVARELGHGDIFASDAPFGEEPSSHRPLWEGGITGVVSVMDPLYGGEEPPGTHWETDDTAEHCSAASLQAVGEVTLAALRRITARLVKVDMISGRAERRAAEALEPPDVEGEAVEDDLAIEDDPAQEEAEEPAFDPRQAVTVPLDAPTPSEPAESAPPPAEPAEGELSPAEAEEATAPAAPEAPQEPDPAPEAPAESS